MTVIIEQKQLWQWVREHQARVPALTMFAMTSARDKPSADAWPLQHSNCSLMVPSGRMHGLFIDLKANVGAEPLRHNDWRDPFRRRGYRAEIVVGWVLAARLIAEYLEPTLTERERRALHASIPMG